MTAPLRTLVPESRIDALAHLAYFIDIVTVAFDDADDCRAIVRQARCDLHALGVTSAELDAAGIR